MASHNYSSVHLCLDSGGDDPKSTTKPFSPVAVVASSLNHNRTQHDEHNSDIIVSEHIRLINTRQKRHIMSDHMSMPLYPVDFFPRHAMPFPRPSFSVVFQLSTFLRPIPVIEPVSTVYLHPSKASRESRGIPWSFEDF